MKDWIFTSVFVLATVAGFLGVDKFFVEWSRRLADDGVTKKVLRIFSCTPLIIFLLVGVPSAIFLFQQNWLAITQLWIACGLALGVSFALKFIFMRRRPYGRRTEYGETDSSFPSAHTAGSVAAAFSLAVFWPEFAAVFYLASAGVALSRIALKFHFFSDVAAGVLLAWLAVEFVWRSELLKFLGIS